ncbi:MAG TPA: AAA family ATPase, partial [Candidatus Limnocylindria bacterium]|nr:AAA family ATPase [Candidatus Limnocylindria bacterium]
MYPTATRFLAREKELEVLRRRVADAVAGKGGLVLLAGAPGMGTTRLAREVADRAIAAGMSVAWGECRAGLLDRPFGALAEAMESGSLTMPAGQVLTDLGADAGPLLRICPGLASTLPTLVPAVPLEPVDERLRLNQALFGWMTRMAARAPLLVVLDEYQLADADLRQAVDHLAKRLRGAPVLLLCVSSVVVKKARATKPPGVLDALTLEGLDLGATAALISALSDRPVVPATVQLIQEVGHGNPLLSVELHRHMAEENLLPAPGSAGLPAAAALPQTLADVVPWRVARLPAANRAALNVLAAFPRGAAANIVATVAGVIRGRAVEALDGLVADGIAAVDTAGTRYVVFHPHVRTALLDAMAPHLRAQLHRRVAEVLEAEAGNERRQIAGELAHYWYESRAIPGRERGLGHFLLATEQARAAYAHYRAVDCLRAALTVAPEDNSTRFDLVARLALAEAAAGLRKEALATAARALELGDAATPAHAADRAAPSNEAISAVTDTLRAVRADGVHTDQTTGLEILRKVALERLGSDRSARSESLPHARLNLLEESWQEADLAGANVLVWSDLQPQAATVLTALGTEADRAEVMLIQRPRSRADTAAAAEAARAWKRPAATLRALAATASDLVGRLGMFDEGQGWATQYLATAERYGSVRDRVRALALLARCHAARGEFWAAIEKCDQADALLPALAGGPSPSPEMLADEAVFSRFSMDYFLDPDWRATLKSVSVSKKARPTGLLMAALRCIAL